jgi:hypothetical protein
MGWLNGARLLETWFSRARSVAPNYTAPETTTIKMDSWVLTFKRANNVYDEILQGRIWSNPPARAEVAKMLRRKNLLGSAPQPFGRLGDPVPLQDPDYINERPVGDYTKFDDMTAALGYFNLRVVVAGTVGPAPSAGAPGPGAAGPPRYEVRITEVGVYVRDSFDFEGDQYLGCWSDNPDAFSPLMPPSPGGEFGMSFQPPLFTPIGNRDFRAWRDKTSRGGDFLVFSDLKRITLTPPDTFVI